MSDSPVAETVDAAIGENERGRGPGKVLVGVLGLRPGGVEFSLEALAERRGRLRGERGLRLGSRVSVRIRRRAAGRDDENAQAREVRPRRA